MNRARAPRRLALLSLLALPALADCAAIPAPPPVEVRELPPDAPASSPPAPPLTSCDALAEPLRALRQLAAVVSLGRSMPIQPIHVARFGASLTAHAAQARGVKTGDAELAKLAADVAARLAKIAESARAFEGRRGADAEPARVVLLEEMERGELFVQVGEARCKQTEGLAGRLSGSALQRGVRPGLDAFKQCQQAGLRRDRGLAGVVRVRFTVARDGSVSEASDEDRGPPDPLAWGLASGAPPMRDAEVSACVVAAFARLKFPKPSGGTFSATYPITLDAR